MLELTIYRKESATKTVNRLLDKDPRWLRPKNREEMDRRICEFSDCTTHRKHLRRFSRKSHGSKTNVDPLTTTLGIDPLLTPGSSALLRALGKILLRNLT
jgi:hypothetical protein